MKKLLLKSLALLLVVLFIMSTASLALTASAATYVNGGNSISKSYKGGRYYHNLTQVTLTGNNRADILAVALSQARYQENSNTSSLSGETGTSGNFTEYSWNYGNGLGTYSYAWCACFVTWCLRQTGINTLPTGLSNAARNHLGDAKHIWNEVSCGYWVSQLQKTGYWKASAGRGGGTYVPKSGDLIFFENGGDSWSDHIGIVVYVSGSTVYTIEGNTSPGNGQVVANGGGVYFKNYPLSSTYIFGYGAMPYNTTSSPIDYSGNNPTPGLYVTVSGNKYLYTDTSLSGYIKIPGGSVFSVEQVIGTGISESTLLKTTYTDKTGATYTGYVKNNTDRVVQITQTSGGSSSGGTSGGGTSSGGTTMTPGSAQLAAVIGAVGYDGGALTGVGSGMTANHAVINELAYNGTATTIDWQGWAMINGGQQESFLFSTDGGSTWKGATLSAKADGTPDTMDTAVLGLSGVASASSWANLGTAGSAAYTSAHFIVNTDLSAYAGKTVSVTLGRTGTDGAVYKIARITGVSVPAASSSGGSSSGGSSSGGTTTNTIYYAGFADSVNGTSYSDFHGTQASQQTKALNISTTSLNIVGWCAITGGQGDLYYTTDGGTTWKALTNTAATASSEYSAILGLAQAKSGAPSTASWGSDQDYRYNVTIDLSSYAGKTIGTLTLGRKANSDSSIRPFISLTGITVPAASSEGGSTSGSATITGTVVATGEPTRSWPYATSITSINGTGGYTLSGYRTSTTYTANPKAIIPATIDASANSISVSSDKKITIGGWGVVNGGQSGYVYSIDGKNWYACTGTLSTSSTDISDINTLITDKKDLWQISDVSAVNCRFTNLTANLAGCEGSTVNLMFGIRPALDNTVVCHFMTINNLSVPASSSGGTSGGGSTNVTPPTATEGNVTNVAIPSTHSCSWSMDTNGKLSCGTCGDSITPATHFNASELSKGYNMADGDLSNQGAGLKDMGTYCLFMQGSMNIWYFDANMQQYMVIKYNIPTGQSTIEPNMMLSYYRNYDETTGAANVFASLRTIDGNDHSAVIDMTAPVSSSNGPTGVGKPGQTFSIWADFNSQAEHDIRIYYIATFASATDAARYAAITEGSCTHSSTTDAVSPRAATCHSTGYTAGKKCATCGTITEQPQAIAANSNHSWSANTCTHASRTCTGCGATQPGTLGHYDNNGDNACDACTISMGTSTGGTATGSTTTGNTASGTVTNTTVPTVHSCSYNTDDKGMIYCTGCNKKSPIPATYASGTRLGSTHGIVQNGAYTDAYSVSVSNGVATYPTASSLQIQYNDDVSSLMQRYALVNMTSTGDTVLAMHYYGNSTASVATGKLSKGSQTVLIDMQASLSLFQGVTNLWGFSPNWGNYNASVSVERIVTFASQADANNYATYLGYLNCTHSGTTGATTAKAATCGATGYTSGTKCSNCGYVTEQPQKTNATTSHSWSANTCTGGTRTCSTCLAQQPGTLSHSWSADTCTGTLRSCSTCSSTQAGTLSHSDGNGDNKCDSCGTTTSSGGGTTTTPAGQVSDLAAVVNNINGIGPDGTADSNYAAQLISTGTLVSSVPILESIIASGSITLNGWCMINGGQNNVIKYSTDGGLTWLGNCTGATFSDGDSSFVQLAKDFVGMPNPSATNAIFTGATVAISALNGAPRVTFGREGADGKIYPFATLTGLSDTCPHTNCNVDVATCETAKICQDCGSIVQAAFGHNWQTVAAKPATCSENGNSAGETCSNCGKTTTLTIQSVGHIYNIYVAGKAATCTEDGLTDTKKCSCGQLEAEQVVIPATGHNGGETWYNDAATNTHYKLCSCGVRINEASHTIDSATQVCTVCKFGCNHVAGSAPSCTAAQTCTICGATLNDALGHKFSTYYQSDDTHHWNICTRSGCGASSEKIEHSYVSNKCVCGAKLNVQQNFHSSVDWVNGVGPNNDTNTPYVDKGNNTNTSNSSIAMPFTHNVTYLKIQGWALTELGVDGYKWSVDGITWNTATFDSLSSASNDHIAASANSGITESSPVRNSIFVGLCADLSAYAGKTNLNVSFAAVSGEDIIPIITITGVNVGTPAQKGASFDEFIIGGTSQGFAGFTSGTVGGVTITGADSSTGALTMTNLMAGTNITLWGWVGYDAEISSFGYYFNGYSSDITYVEHYPTTEDAIINLAGQYARRMRITVDTSALSGTNSVTFIARFSDGSIKELATWNLSVTGLGNAVTAPSDGSGRISNQYANVILISGQSNAYGASPTTQSNFHVTNLYGNETFSNIKIHYTNINGGGGPNDPMRVIIGNSGFETYKVGIGGQNADYMGPEFGLAQYLKANYTNGEQFYIIKFTAAGTFLNGDWLPGDAYYDAFTASLGYAADVESRPHASPTLNDYLFNLMIYDFQNSIATIKASTSLPIKIHSFMWVQGESDAGHPIMASDYKAREAQLVSGIRSAFSEYSAAGGISYVNYQIVDKAHPQTGAAVWPYASTLNASKQANAQYIFNVGTSTLGEQKSNYGIGKSVLLDKTDWNSKLEAGFDSDAYHLDAVSMQLVGQAFGAAMTAMDGKSIAHTHTPTEIPAVAPTCTESGYSAGVKCSTCDRVLTAPTLVSATGHTYTDDADANCNVCGFSRDDGSCSHSFDASAYQNDKVNYHYHICTLCGTELNREEHVYDNSCDPTCSACGYERTVSHTIITVSAVPATCVSAGRTESQACASCGMVVVAAGVIEKLNHEYVSSTIAATCTQRGYTAHTCKNGCGTTYNTNYTNPKGHSYSSQAVTASCTSVGYTLHSCACGVSYKDNFSPALSHVYTSETVAPTCTSIGYTSYSCNNCSKTYKDTFVPAKGHSYTETVIEATCITRGYTQYQCSDCRASYYASFEDALSHSYTVTTVASTCFVKGYDLHSCSRCDSVYYDNFQDAAHDYTEDKGETHTTFTCKSCGNVTVKPNVAEHTHAYNAVVTAPTCTSDGYTTYTCACGDTMVADYVSMTGHTFTESVKAPTCTEGGYTTRTCACGYSETVNPTAAKGHTMVQTSRVYPTMTVTGYTDYACACGATERGNYISYYTDLIGGGAYVSSQKQLTPIAQGLDVSYWQNNQNQLTPFPFTAAKSAGIDYVIIRAGTTNMKDPAFEMNYADAKAAGLDVGVYFYTYASTVEGAKQDAYKLLEWLKGKKFEYPIYYDVENDAQKNAGKATVTAMINAFMEIMQSNGYYTSLYIYQAFILYYADTDYCINNYDIWMAQYPNTNAFYWNTGTPPTWNNANFNGTFGMWQFASTGHIDGYSGNLDSNLCWKDYPTLIKKYGLNGYDADPNAGSDSAPSTEQYVWIVSTVNSLNVRSSPDFTSTTNILGTVSGGTRLVLLERNTAYTKVMYNGQVAYISANSAYVQFTAP